MFRQTASTLYNAAVKSVLGVYPENACITTLSADAVDKLCSDAYVDVNVRATALRILPDRTNVTRSGRFRCVFHTDQLHGAVVGQVAVKLVFDSGGVDLSAFGDDPCVTIIMQHGPVSLSVGGMTVTAEQAKRPIGITLPLSKMGKLVLRFPDTIAALYGWMQLDVATFSLEDSVASLCEKGNLVVVQNTSCQISAATVRPPSGMSVYTIDPPVTGRASLLELESTYISVSNLVFDYYVPRRVSISVRFETFNTPMYVVSDVCTVYAHAVHNGKHLRSDAVYCGMARPARM